MEVQEVDLVDTETAERLLNSRLEVLWLSVDHAVSEDVSDLGADKDLVTLSSALEPIDNKVRPRTRQNKNKIKQKPQTIGR